MLILLTNDDGIMAPGILAMYRALQRLGEVVVVAPETPQSATGHGITLTGPLLTSRVRVEGGTDGGFEGIAVDGRPADCVKLAVDQLLPRRPDLVVSGINHGANVGIHVLYSGTVAAAIEGAFLGLPAVAVSLHLRREVPVDFARAAEIGVTTIEQILAHGLAAGQVASVNVPALRADERPAGVRVVRQATAAGPDVYDRRQDPRGRYYFWSAGVFSLAADADPDCDVGALREKYVTVTPLSFDLTDHRRVREWQVAWASRP